MQAQDIFDKVVEHLRKQNEKSLCSTKAGTFYICAYRSENGKQCAAGCLIPEADYLPEMESKPWMTLLEDFSLLTEEYPWMREHRELIRALQLIHDDEEVSYWETALESCARGFKLMYNPPFHECEP